MKPLENKARTALINLRDGMRYTYKDIIVAGYLYHKTSASTLCRIYKGAYEARPELAKAIIEVHNVLCKRGEKIK